MLIGLVAIVSLLLVNGFFVAAEFALARSRRSRLEAMARAGDRQARVALRALGNVPRALSATQLGITLASLTLGTLAEDTLGDYLAGTLATLPGSLAFSTRIAIGVGIALALLTVVHAVFAELLPRAFAITHPERTARWVASPLLAFAWAARPLTSLIGGLASLVTRTFGLRRGDTADESVQTTEELRLLVEQSQEGGLLGERDATLIEGVFEFSEKTAREVMTPRTDVNALPAEATLDEALATIIDCGHSRYPVYIDTIDNIVGIVLSKDLLAVLRHPPEQFSLQQVLRPVHVVPGTRDVEDVLADFKRLKEHMAVVLDEYGGTAGILTMEDLLEEIVGEILDEYDEPGTPVVPERGEDVCVAGGMHIGELNERFGLEVPDGDYTTLGGFIFTTLGRLPTVGDRVAAGNAVFAVREMDGRRIAMVAVDLHTMGDRREKEREAIEGGR